MNRLEQYLLIPESDAERFRWSAGRDAIDGADGSTFAMTDEVVRFLEGFASQRHLIEFGFVLHLLGLLRVPHSTDPHDPFARIYLAYHQSGRRARNAGAFCAGICEEVPRAPDPPSIAELLVWRNALWLDQWGGHRKGGEDPPLSREAFEGCLARALARYTDDELVHWLRHGQGPLTEQGEQLARALLAEKPPSFDGVLTDLSRHERLAGAIPFVAQLVSALTLPPRRRSDRQLPQGGYSDVTARGHPEQILLSQFALDELEFVRRHAENELLYYSREEPHAQTREGLVVLLDQGVRCWGPVRLVLAAAVLALGRLAQQRRLEFRVAVSSASRQPVEPSSMAAPEFAELLAASDLSAHPALALERVLEETPDQPRDVVLLTHPRNLTERDVGAAARRAGPGTRLFALGVDGRGAAEFGQVLRGTAVALSRFQIDLDRPAPAPSQRPKAYGWHGDVEPVGFPFCFGGGAAHGSFGFDFDHGGEWLLTSSGLGMLHLTRTDGSAGEVLPRGLHEGRAVTDVRAVLGVAGGFVAAGVAPGRWLVAVHYDLGSRGVRLHRFPGDPRVADTRVEWRYWRSHHTLLVRQGDHVDFLQLSTGEQRPPPAAELGWGASPAEVQQLRGQVRALPPQREGGPPHLAGRMPLLAFQPETGALSLRDVLPAWKPFTPLADGKPALRGANLLAADCQRHTLAAAFASRDGLAPRLWIFRGPQGVPLANYPMQQRQRLVLSGDGRLLAVSRTNGQVEVREALAAGAPRCLTPSGRFHHDVAVALGERWLSMHVGSTFHLARWNEGRLLLHQGRDGRPNLPDAPTGPQRGSPALPGPMPGFLGYDSQRFRAAVRGNLIAAVDLFGQVFLFEHGGALVCAFFAFRQQFAAWMPDGTAHGPAALLGRPATPDAAAKIGQALLSAWERGEGRSP